MRVSASPDFLESIANHPRVRPYLGGEGEVRAGDSWKGSIGLEWPDGGVVFMREAPGIYGGHLVFSRGAKDVRAKLAQAFDYLFAHSDAHTITAQFPPAFRHVARIVRDMGMTERGGFYALTARQWIQHKERAYVVG